MTRYWPLSVIARSPMLHHLQAWELLCSYHVPKLSNTAMVAANHVAGQTPPNEAPLIIVYHEGSPSRRMYLLPPEPGDFEILERGGFHAWGDAFAFIIDALH